MIPTLSGSRSPRPNFRESIRRAGQLQGLQGCYDLGDVRSWPGAGEPFFDLSGQGNDMFNGAALGDAISNMAFSPTGVPGRRTKEEYFERNAATGLALVGGVVPAWLQQAHQDNGKISFCQWTKTPSGAYSMGSIGNNLTAAGANLGPGWAFGISNGAVVTLGLPIFSISIDAAGTTGGVFAGSAVVTNTGTWMFSGVAVDEQAGTYSIMIDDVITTGACAYTSPAAGAAGSSIFMGPSGTAIHDKACWALWDRSLGPDGLARVRQMSKGRFS